MQIKTLLKNALKKPDKRAAVSSNKESPDKEAAVSSNKEKPDKEAAVSSNKEKPDKEAATPSNEATIKKEAAPIPNETDSPITESGQDLKRRVKFTAPKEKVHEAFQKSFKKVQQKTTITGFRPGKAPPKTLMQSQYYSSIWEKAADTLFSEFYPKALADNQLHVAGEPKILNITLEENKPCVFELEVEVHPEVIVKNYLNLPVKKEDTTVTSKQINEVLENLQKNFKKYEDVEKTESLKPGLFGVFSMEAQLKSGKKFKPLCEKQALIGMGLNSIAPGFDTHLLEMKTGEQRLFPFSFPKDHQSPLAGKTLSFTVKLTHIKKEITHNLDDEFAQMFKAKTLEELKKRITTEIQSQNEKKAKENLKNSILQELIKQNPLTLPESLVKEKEKTLLKKMEEKLKTNKMPAENIKTVLKENQKQIKESAKQSIHTSYLMETLIRNLKIEVTGTEAEEHLKKQSPHLDSEEIKTRLKNQHLRAELTYRVSIEKTIDYLIDQANVQ